MTRRADSGAMTTSSTGLMIIRVWSEEGSEQPLRANIRYTTDISAGIERGVTLTQVDAVCETVRQWLQDMITDDPPS